MTQLLVLRKERAVAGIVAHVGSSRSGPCVYDHPHGDFAMNDANDLESKFWTD